MFFWPQNRHLCIDFQKVGQFWYRQSLANLNSSSEFMRFSAIFGNFGRFLRNCRKSGPFFLTNVAFWPCKNCRTLWILTNSYFSDFANIKNVRLFENRCKYGDSVAKRKLNSFFLYFFGITQVKVENQLIFVKLLKNPQFLTKIHKVGLVWSATLICTD